MNRREVMGGLLAVGLFLGMVLPPQVQASERKTSPSGSETGGGWGRNAGAMSAWISLVGNMAGGSVSPAATGMGGDVLLLWRPLQTEADGSLSWSGETMNWELSGGGGKSAFTPGASVLFDGGETLFGPRIAVAEGMAPGNLTFSSSADYTLTGARLGGTGSFLKTGTGTLTLDGTGLDAQPIHVAGGILKLGMNVSADALGDIAVPLKVSGDGTLDINYGHSDPNDFARNEVTHRKIIQIEGDGVGGGGALVNNGPCAGYKTLGRLELTGDATIGGTNRFDLRMLENSASLQERPLISGPGHVLTIKNTDAFGVVGGDVDLEKIVIAEGGKLRPEENTTLGLREGIELMDGSFNPFHVSGDFTFPITAVSGKSKITVDRDGGNVTFRGAIGVDPGAELEFVGVGNSSSLYGALTNRGTLRMAGGELRCYGSVWSDGPIELTGGTFSCGYDNYGWPTFERPTEFLLNGGSFRFMCSDQRVAENLKLKGRSAVHFLTHTPGGTIELRNSEIETGDWIQIANSWNYGTVLLGEGCEVRAGGLGLGEFSSNPKSSLLRLLPGSSLWISKNGENVRIGRRSDSTRTQQHMLSVEGGTCIITNSITMIGWDCAHAAVQMSSGRLDAQGIKLRKSFRYDHNQGNTYEHFVMSGGSLNMGRSGFFSERSYFNDETGIYLNGGTIVNTAAWGTSANLNLAFAGDPVVWDLGKFLVNFNVALQGDGDVTLLGNADFNSSPYNDGSIRSAGTVRGHWTIGNGGANSLHNAAAFTKGLTLEEGVRANVRIPGTGYVRLEIYRNVPAAECESSVKYMRYLERELHFVNQEFSTSRNTSYLYTGEFYVSADQAGRWTFAESFSDELCFKVDGIEVLNDTVRDEVSKGQIQLDEGWHCFRLAVKKASGNSGPVGTSWIQKNMGLGWNREVISSTAASDYTPFSPDYLPMRPDVTGEDRLQLAGNSVCWSRHAGTEKDWKTLDTWDSTVVTNSLQAVSVTDWEPGFLAVNRFKGWFYVDGEKAGVWTFRGAYDDNCTLLVDGFNSEMDGHHQVEGLRCFDLSRGWHRFELRVYDCGGTCGPVNSSEGATVQYQINGGPWSAFDESTLAFRAFLVLPNTEYGFIGGLIELKDNSLLTNEIDRKSAPCSITGTLRGTGTLAGGFAFATNGVWEIGADAHELTRVVSFGEGTHPDTLKDLRRVKVIFSEKPVCMSYPVCDSLGLEKTVGPDGVSLPLVEVVATDPTGTASYPFRAAVRGNTFVLLNKAPPGSYVILR